MSAGGGKGQPVAWRFYATGSEWLKDDWTVWSASESFRSDCEKLGWKIEFAYPENSPDPVRAELVEALKIARPYVEWSDEHRSPEEYPEAAEILRKKQLKIDAALKAAGEGL